MNDETTSKSGQDWLTAMLASSLHGDLPSFTPRTIHGRVDLPGKVTAVVGMRRAGKTTFVHQQRQERLDAGMERNRMPYLNFEDERLVGLTVPQLHPMVEDYYRNLPEVRGRATVMWSFDEIQLVPGWERFVRRMLDTERVEIFVTGSSAALLSREVATALRGRAWEVVMHPFSFEEALRYQGKTVPSRPDFLDSPSRSAIESAFIEYLSVGGFPEAQGLDVASRSRLLNDYVDVAILRDVVERHGVSQVVGLRWMVRHLLGNAGGAFSIERFYSALRSQGIGISRDTLHQLLNYLQDCFLIRTVWMDAASERQRMVNPRKAYPVDPGLIPLFDRTGRANTGHALETAVLIELERRHADITYVRTPQGFEVDFLARYPNGSSELIQVCADARAAETAHRELRALNEAASLYPNARLSLLTLTIDRLPPETPAGIKSQPAYVWLLASPTSIPTST